MKVKHLLSIRRDGECLGHARETDEGKIVTEGYIGDDNEYENFIDLLRGLQGFDIKVDDFFF